MIFENEADDEIDRLKLKLIASDEAHGRIIQTLISAAILINALLDELLHTSRMNNAPMPLQLIAAKGTFDLQMKQLLGIIISPKTPQEPKP